MSVLCRLRSLQRDTENYQYIDAKLNTAFSLSILENVSCYFCKSQVLSVSKQVLALGIKVLCGKKVSKDSALSTHVGPSILKMSISNG